MSTPARKLRDCLRARWIPRKASRGRPTSSGLFVAVITMSVPYVAEKKEWEEGSEKNEEEDAEDFLGATPPYMKREDPF